MTSTFTVPSVEVCLCRYLLLSCLAQSQDAAHATAVEFSETYTGSIVTSEWILLELGDALCKASDKGRLRILWDVLRDDPDTTIVPLSHELFEQAGTLYFQRQDNDWSLTDCTSFIIMHERQLTDALTADRHFIQAGFRALLATS